MLRSSANISIPSSLVPLLATAHELRATMSSPRLFAKQGHRDEAHAILAQVYNWFTESFDTTDLKDAKKLLDELNG